MEEGFEVSSNQMSGGSKGDPLTFGEAIWTFVGAFYICDLRESWEV